MTELFNSHWLNKKYKLDKFSITWLRVLVTNYQKYMAFCPSYSLPKKKKKMKIKPRSTYPNTLNSEARLWSGKVLSTHSTQIESGLLDSRDQCTHFTHDMNDMLHTWTKLIKTDSHESILWICHLLYFFKKLDLFLRTKKIYLKLQLNLSHQIKLFFSKNWVFNKTITKKIIKK